jgi:hypothetical protein
MSKEFYPYETHFFSFFLKTLPHHPKRLCDSLLNANKTLMKLALRLALAAKKTLANPNRSVRSPKQMCPQICVHIRVRAVRVQVRCAVNLILK